MARNLTEALTTSLARLMKEGAEVPSRNGPSREIYAHQVFIERPLERVIMTPARGANIFAQLAEAVWVMAGRDDMEFLSRYLPRARDYSDDGETWRGAYGPRLRAWPLGDNPPVHSQTNPDPTRFVDQLEECVKLLCENPETRRAVMIIFDPARDYCQSKDIPCNNWLHFLIRDGKLNLTVGVRSNDAIWGFSGINMFEWSILQEWVAHWVGVEAGTMAYTASSFHLYEYHWERAEKIVARAKPKTLYSFGFPTIPFQTGWEDLRHELRAFFKVEAGLSALDEIADPFLQTSATMLAVYRMYQEDASAAAIAGALMAVPESDLRVAAIDFFRRQKRMREEGFMDLVELSQRERYFFDWYSRPPKTDVSLKEIYATLKLLHWKKTRSYGDSWKKHGEVLGLFSNITRKRDRIGNLAGGAVGLADEGMFDTISDLCVYAGKYLTLLAELYPDAFRDFLTSPDAQVVYPCEVDPYAHTMGFDLVTDMLLEHEKWADHPAANKGLAPAVGSMDNLDAVLSEIEDEYRVMEEVLTAPTRTERGERVTPAAARMCLLCAQALRILSKENPGTWDSYVNIIETL